jgi:hypothetical protein
MNLIARWNGMSRQKRVGWMIIVISILYLLYFMKARMFAAGPEITRKEWIYFGLTFVGIMLGTINVRMGEMRERNQQIMSPSDFSRPTEK